MMVKSPSINKRYSIKCDRVGNTVKYSTVGPEKLTGTLPINAERDKTYIVSKKSELQSSMYVILLLSKI